MELITTKSIGGDHEGCPSSVILNEKHGYLGYIGGIYSFLGIIWILWRLYMGIIWDSRDFIGDYTTQFIGIIWGLCGIIWDCRGYIGYYSTQVCGYCDKPL